MHTRLHSTTEDKSRLLPPRHFALVGALLMLIYFFVPTNVFAQANVQIIHNSPDPAAEVVDIYVEDDTGTLVADFDDVAFRTATGFNALPAGDYDITVAGPGSTGPNDQDIATFSATLNDGENYSIVANGVLSPGDFAPNPNGVATAFNLDIATGARPDVDSNDGDVELRAVHGSPDAPEVDVLANGNPFVPGVQFRDISGYLGAGAGPVTLDVAPAGAGAGSSVATFEVDLGPFADTPLTVLASGFLDPSAQTPSPVAPFTLIAVAPDGTVIDLGASQAQIVHNAPDPAAEVVDIYVDGALAVDDFTFRSATGFIDLDSGVRELAVAPGTSNDVGDAIYTLDAQVPINEALTVVANGVSMPDFASNPDGVATDFDLDIATGARPDVDSNDGDVELRAVHGSPDAPEVDVLANGNPFVPGVQFRDISGYLGAGAGPVTLDVAPAGAGVGSSVATFEVDLGPFADTPLTVLASGFLDPSAQTPSPVAPFTLIAVAPDGSVINLGSDLIINEFLANPDGSLDANNDGTIDDTDDQFVELLNVSTTTAIDVSGYSIETGAGTYTFPSGSPTLSPSEGLVVFSGGSPAGFEVFAGTGLPNLDGANGDTIVLSNDSGTPLQTVSFQADASGNAQAPQSTLEQSVTQQGGVSTARDESGAFVLHTAIAANPVDASPGEVNVSGAPLPVELAGFDAQVNENDVVLNWTTLSETNNSGFEVQQRVEGSFERIGFKEGQGTTDVETSYSFVISDLEPGTYVFRLKQIDLDGSPSLSEPIEAEVSLTEAFTWTRMAPNPIRNRGRISLQVQTTQDVTVALYDVLGRQVKVLHEGRLEAGNSHSLSVDNQDLSSGMYFLRVKGEQFSDTQRISVVR